MLQRKMKVKKEGKKGFEPLELPSANIRMEI